MNDEEEALTREKLIATVEKLVNARPPPEAIHPLLYDALSKDLPELYPPREGKPNA